MTIPRIVFTPLAVGLVIGRLEESALAALHGFCAAALEYLAWTQASATA